jgi:hypothetical protein
MSNPAFNASTKAIICLDGVSRGMTSRLAMLCRVKVHQDLSWKKQLAPRACARGHNRIENGYHKRGDFQMTSVNSDAVGKLAPSRMLMLLLLSMCSG